MVELADDSARRHRLTADAHSRVLRNYNWYVDGKKFVAEVEKACLHG